MSKEEIEEAIDRYGFRVPYDGSNEFYDREAIKHFRAGIEWCMNQQQSEIEKLKASETELSDYRAKDLEEIGNLTWNIKSLQKENEKLKARVDMNHRVIDDYAVANKAYKEKILELREKWKFEVEENEKLKERQKEFESAIKMDDLMSDGSYEMIDHYQIENKNLEDQIKSLTEQVEKLKQDLDHCRKSKSNIIIQANK